MLPRHRFHLPASIPADFADLDQLARNLAWAWNSDIAAVFDAIAGGPDWRAGNTHPLALIERTTAARWAELSADPEFLAALAAARDRFEVVRNGPSWCGERAAAGSALTSVAYFSPEFGITEALAQYSGGLGVLAGDHLKASSDLGVPLIGVGLLYAEGYFHQELNPDGWQHERNDRVRPESIGIEPTGVTVTVDLAGVEAKVAVWRVDVGRIPLYLLDTNVAGNPPEVVAVTNRLYGGDEQHRLRQEIVLGIGGVRALRALDIHPQVFHMNEGHAGFLGLERVREHVEAGLGFHEAIEATSAGGVFTTHTPVPAGIDRFERGLFEHYFRDFATALGVSFDELFALGQRDDEPDGKFNMAVMGLRLACRRNGVAQLHGTVSRSMFGGMWPQLPSNETPISHVTNGVHARSWVAPRVDELFTDTIGDDWHLASRERWQSAFGLDDARVWEARRAGRRELVDMVRSRLGRDLLDPEALTIGFARRFATYKRATLLLLDLERLTRLLLDADRPVQFVFAGKAHPADHPGKSLIQQIHHVASSENLRHRFVLVPDYDIGVARTMYHGCDVWLNTPRRPMEACGTSGMKAALNGCLNLSIRDGWWDEMSDGTNGWDIPTFDDPDDGRRDRREAAATLDLIADELVPMFYDRTSDDVPHRWVSRMKANWATLGWNVVAGRMVRDYVTSLYEPAAASAETLTSDEAAGARQLAAWKRGVRDAWATVSIDVDEAALTSTDSAPRRVVARVERGALAWDELKVQAVHGPIGSDGSFDEDHVVTVDMTPATPGSDASSDASRVFSVELDIDGAGAWGVTARVLPVHPGLASDFDTGLMTLG